MDFVLDLAWWGLIYILLPVALGTLGALTFWLKRRMLLGNAVGSTIIAVVMIVFILQALTSQLSSGFVSQEGLIPIGLLVLAGWVDVLILFFVGGAVEDRVKRRIVNPDDF